LSELEIVGRIIRDPDNTLLVKKGTYWNTEVVDARWYSNNKPSRKGIRVNLEEAKLLLDILRRVLDE